MSEFFAFDELTWPEVEALTRQTPLALPSGHINEMDIEEQISNLLVDNQRVGLLPALPFGWERSGLPVEPGLLETCRRNLHACLQEDGFERTLTLAPVPQDNLQFPADSEQGKVVLIPVGHTEQHAYHLPLSTDTLIIEAIARGVVAEAPDLTTALPVMPYGVSMHRRAFPGTFNIGGRLFEDFWLGVIDTLVVRGFDRFYLLSGHGGNCSFLTNIVKYAGERHPRVFCATSWLYLSGPSGVAALEQRRKSSIGGMGHACELETSLILHLRPDLVHMEKAVDEIDFISTSAYYMDWVEGGALVANPPWEDDTASGAYGAGSLANAENGKVWLQAAIKEKVDHVAEIHEQHRRREARRQSGYGRWGSAQSSKWKV
jgi:creatinine amidohydrolase